MTHYDNDLNTTHTIMNSFHRPSQLALASEENVARYPYAIALQGALRSYAVARELITPELEPLVSSHLKHIRESIAEAFGVSLDSAITSSSSRRIRWGAKELREWVAGLTELVTRFEERVETLLEACIKMEAHLDALSKVDYKRELFEEVVGNIQKTVDDLSLAGYSELNSWVKVINLKIGAVLRDRLEKAVEVWVSALEKNSEIEREDGEGDQIVTANVNLPSINIDIILRNQEIVAAPALPTVRSIFVRELHNFMGIVCSLKSPQSGRFEVFESSSSDLPHGQIETFSHLVNEINPITLAKAYGCIESHMHSISLFVSSWLAYQTLWDTRVADAASAIGEDMDLWYSVLNEAAVARNTLDTSRSFSKFGPVTIKFDKVRSQINLKYDSWQKELQNSYATVLGNNIGDMHNKVCNARASLEDISLEGGGSTESIVIGVSYIQESKQNLDSWGSMINKFLSAERILKRQRHSFHSEWIEGSRLSGAYLQFEQILQKRSRTVDEQFPLLQARILSEEKVANQRTSELLENWDEEKPLRGNIVPVAALELLSKYEFTMKKAKTDDENLIKAKDALGLDAAMSNSDISSCFQELLDLKEVWNAMSGPYEQLNEVKEIPWATVVTRKMRKQLEDILSGK
jgi:dynein heavy chain 1